VKTLIIFGAGGHGKVVADTAREVARWDRIVFVDARYPELDSCGQWPVIAHDMQSLVENFKGADFVVAIGNNSLRLRLLQESSLLGFEQVNIIHPSS
jgi:ornithine cyclodeaminase/alanine dehydrogenase-like protein (mu-crystallin family)